MALFDTLQATTEMVQVGIERSQAESIARSIAKVQGDGHDGVFGFTIE